MAVISNKRSIMTLYSGQTDVYSHRVRVALAEKGVAVDIIDVNPERLPEDFIELNPYNTLPTLIDRDLVLYEPNIIIEYLDERFPHPPLLPVYPVFRAKSRLMIHRIDQDWYTLMHKIMDESVTDDQREQARKELLEALVSITPVFASQPYFLSDEFTLIDCVLAPLLWRLPQLGIELPKKAKAIAQYADRIFERDAFQASLTESENELRGMPEVFDS